MRGGGCVTVVDHTPPIGLDTLRRLAPGTARVLAAVVGENETLVTLGYPRGRDIVVRVPEVPRPGDYDAPSGLRNVLAAQIRNGAARTDCTLLATSWGGPRRVPISVTQALALAHSGVHTVLLSD
jgi:hypothetical protein